MLGAWNRCFSRVAGYRPSPDPLATRRAPDASWGNRFKRETTHAEDTGNRGRRFGRGRPERRCGSSRRRAGRQDQREQRRQGEGPDLARAWSGAIKRGFPITISETKRVEWPTAYKEATEKYAPQVKLSADGLTVQNYVAGQPFPNLDPKDPQFALKIMWNYEYGFANGLDDTDLRNFDADTGSIPQDGPDDGRAALPARPSAAPVLDGPALRRSEAGQAESRTATACSRGCTRSSSPSI